MARINELYGSMVFNDAVMRERLPKQTYKALKESIDTNKELTMDIANVVAAEMKNWAIENGATHFAHWFLPLTGVNAEKHDAFISPVGDGTVLMEFSGKELIKGEPDGSSFPTGGIRATFEARGYTNWDPTSYAFIKEKTLCIPTAFAAFGGEALDEKTPLLRSLDALGKQTMRLMKIFKMDDVKKIVASCGAEQEYFLIDEEAYKKRPDLIYTGRTIMGCKPPKRQELDDHYFGAIKPRVKAFMEDLDNELWKLGIPAKTEHNEVAPAQHELAPVYSQINVALDQNQLSMELLRKVARRHGMVCLLHEKPFDGVNGSGKHVNWSVSTDTGINMLDPGDNPKKNSLFMLALIAVIKGVDDYQDLLRCSVASAGNDHRLGGNEAPPAIMSIFLGDEIGFVVDKIIAGEEIHFNNEGLFELGAMPLPAFKKDSTDRNRTSPFAFTGNKFEFRMPGSEQSIGDVCCVLNTIVAESFEQFADRLEGTENLAGDLKKLTKEVLTQHQRIIYNGDNYTEEWVEEAKARGLLNLATTAEAAPAYISEKNIHLFEKHGIFTEKELHARYEVMCDNYKKIVNIETLTMIDMVRKFIIPAVSAYSEDLASAALSKKELGVNYQSEKKILTTIADLAEMMTDRVEELEMIESQSSDYSETEAAVFFRDRVIPKMEELRGIVDELETLTGKDYWPFPSYGDLLFSVQ